MSPLIQTRWTKMANSILNSRLIISATKLCICLTVSKISRALGTICLISLFFGTWLIGSLIMIQIDSTQLVNLRNHQAYQKRNKQLVYNMDKYCRLKERNEILRRTLHHKIESDQNFENEKKNKSLKAWENARKEKLVRENLVYFPQLKQMWCLVPKAGSTSWSNAIVDRLNSGPISIFIDHASTDSLQVVLKQNFGNINRTAYGNAAKSDAVKKVLLVRHPFSRIASAWSDKLSDRKAKVDGMHFFQQFGVHMNRKYRKSRKLVKQKEPTFPEFIDYLIDTKPLDLNEHWMPISLICGVCHIHFDHVIRLEDLGESMEFHLDNLGWPEGYQFPKENQYAGKYDTRMLFRGIPNSKKIKLLEIYKEDFRLFNYSFLNHWY